MHTNLVRGRHLHASDQSHPGLVFLYLIWFCVAVAIAYASSAQTDPVIQVYFSAALLAAMLLFKRLNPENRTFRLLFLGIATFMVLRYVFWRALYTVEFTDWVSFSCAVILFVCELYAILVFLIGNFVNISPITREPVPLPHPDRLPTVDVLVPSYNESQSVLEITLMAALQMRYPAEKVKVILCDDGGTDEKCETGSPESRAAARRRRTQLKALCKSLGAHYTTRARNVAAKAGNLNSAFQQTSGDLIVIFDADHMPTEDFLEQTVGLFLRDPKLFLVQTPHFFVNPDPIEKNLGTFLRMPSENEMFYQVIQRGLDFWNSAFFCGSGAVMRRTHLEITGGLAGDTITEDAETALTLHALGFHSAYISTPLLSGYAPETMGAFIKQRIRWAQGMIQILLLKNPLLKRGLSLPQRICYFNSCLFWLFPFARLIYLFAPCAFLFFGLRIYAANWQTFLAYGVPYIIAILNVSNYLYGKVRWAFVSELYELIQSVYTLPAILSTVVNPRAPKFNVTPKGETLTRDFVSPLSNPFYLLTLINFATIGAGIYRLLHVSGQDEVYPIAITLFWAAANTVLLLAALGALLEKRQRRATPRMPASIKATFVIGEHQLPCRVADLSIGGCKLLFNNVAEALLTQREDAQLYVPVGDEQTETIFHLQTRNLRLEGSRDAIAVGAAFVHESVDECRAKVRLVCGGRQRWIDFQKRRESRLGVFGCFLRLSYLGGKGALAHLSQLLSHTGDTITGRDLETQTAEMQ